MSFYNTVTYGTISVFYFDGIDGGGADFGQDYLSFISKRVGKVDRVLEWCAGPGFIGFSMLAAGLCDQLTLLDINPDATAACRQTIESNDLERVVQVYTSDCMDALKQGDTFDLVVANPPHCGDATPHHRGKSTLIFNDVGWHIHRKFYHQIPSHITPESRIIIQEYRPLSSVEDFKPMIEESDLEFVGAFPCASAKKYYYIESRLSTGRSST